MFKGLKQGIGIALGIVLTCGVFAFTVTGSIKTWTTGETLTATDLNQNVQSLKTAIESASQLQKVGVFASAGSGYTGIIDNGSGSSETVAQITMSRPGQVKNVMVQTTSNTCTSSPVLVLRNNGIDTTVTYTIGAGITSNPVSVAQNYTFNSGDKLTWKATCPTGSVNFSVTYDF